MRPNASARKRAASLLCVSLFLLYATVSRSQSLSLFEGQAQSKRAPKANAPKLTISHMYEADAFARRLQANETFALLSSLLLPRENTHTKAKGTTMRQLPAPEASANVLAAQSLWRAQR